jgi:hypothetical protein
MTTDSGYAVRPPTDPGQVPNLAAVNASDDPLAGRQRNRNGKNAPRGRKPPGAPARSGAAHPGAAASSQLAPREHTGGSTPEGSTPGRTDSTGNGKPPSASTGEDHVDCLI